MIILILKLIIFLRFYFIGISVVDKETPQLTEEQFEEIFFNSKNILENERAKAVLLEKPCQTVLLKLPAEKGTDILGKYCMCINFAFVLKLIIN